MCLNLPSYLLLLSRLFYILFSFLYYLLSDWLRIFYCFISPTPLFFFTNYMLLNNFSGCPWAAAPHRSLLVFVHPVTKNNISWHKLIEIQISLFINKFLLKYCSTHLLEAKVLCFSDFCTWDIIWVVNISYFSSFKLE